MLDNWKFAITSQLRNLLLFHPQTVLPDYGRWGGRGRGGRGSRVSGRRPLTPLPRRIRSLSGALDGLYREFSALKEQLGRLSGRFAEVEASVEQLGRARGPGPAPRRRGLPPPPPRSPL